MVIDHLCRNRACVNVDHLEVVTVKTNTGRGHLKGKVGRKRGSWRGCSRHGESDGYLFTDKLGYTRWTCRICRRAGMARYKARIAVAA